MTRLFSVLISVYSSEQPENLEQSLFSITKAQTLHPSEITLVIDGPIGVDLELTIEKYIEQHPGLFKVIRFTENKGLGYALHEGLKACSNEIIARMDSDDISLSDRFEKQMNFLNNNPEIDVVGSNLEEFNQLPGDLNRFKINPEKHEDLIKKIKLKSPFNHPTIMFRKKVFIEAGNYSKDLMLFEDYSLFLRLWKKGARFHNIQENLLYFRVGTGLETIKRRSGKHYLLKELKFLNYLRSVQIFSFTDKLLYMAIKFPIRLLPPKIVLFIYNSFLRK